MEGRILAFLLVVRLLHEVQICKACFPSNDGDYKVIKMCTVDSITGSTIVLTTFYTAVNTCLCTIEVNSGQFTITSTGQPNSSECGTRIDITNGSILTTFQCKQPQLYNTTKVSFKSGEVTLHKQSNSTEDDVRYCLTVIGPAITISCYGNDSQPPTTTSTETTSTTTVRSSTTTSTTKVPTTTGIMATPPTTTTQQPPSKSLPTSSDTTSKHTTVLTLSTTNHQGDNRDIIVAVIVATTLGTLCITAVVIIVIFVCRRNASKRQMEEYDRNDNYASLSNHTEENSNYEDLNKMQILSVSVENVVYENATF